MAVCSTARVPEGTVASDISESNESVLPTIRRYVGGLSSKADPLLHLRTRGPCHGVFCRSTNSSASSKHISDQSPHTKSKHL